jgi:hypothetical protein
MTESLDLTVLVVGRSFFLYQRQLLLAGGGDVVDLRLCLLSALILLLVLTNAGEEGENAVTLLFSLLRLLL